MDNFYKDLGNKIKTAREECGLTQVKFAKMLNINRTSLSQIEKGERKITADETALVSKFLNIPLNILLDQNKDMQVFLEKEDQPESAGMPEREIRIHVPQKKFNKFREVLLYILNKVGSRPNVGETVIYKLLYFTDFNYYEKYEEQLIGATYQKNNYGPTPKEFRKIVGEMEGKDLEKVHSKYFDYPQTKYLPRREANLDLLNARELELINKVLNKFADMTAKEISDYSHNDVPWLTTAYGDIINYESVFYRTPEYSVRTYSEEDF